MRKTMGRKAEGKWERFSCTVKILLHVYHSLKAFYHQSPEQSIIHTVSANSSIHTLNTALWVISHEPEAFLCLAVKRISQEFYRRRIITRRIIRRISRGAISVKAPTVQDTASKKQQTGQYGPSFVRMIAQSDGVWELGSTLIKRRSQEFFDEVSRITCTVS